MKMTTTISCGKSILAVGNHRLAAIIVPVLSGLISVLLGADTNWDLQNYHLYNAFAFLNGKLDIDLAPAGFQSYFNPLLDLPYFVAMQYLPPRLVGFLMGALHGLNFVLLLGICRTVLPVSEQKQRPVMATSLAAAGMLTANFLSELGSSMGDNTTALFCLGSILVLLNTLRHTGSGQPVAWTPFLIAGAVMGIGVGLKLTNASYAMAVCVALFVFPFTWGRRTGVAFVFGIGVVAGIGLIDGYWFYVMWEKFGNPLFPQFNNFFNNPLALSIAAGDTSWLPKTFWQKIFWPLLISADAQKVGQINIRQIIWGIVYLLLICFVVRTLYLKSRLAKPPGLAVPERFIAVIVIAGFFTWMTVFSIYRYLVPLDMLAPLLVFILCKAILPPLLARQVATVLIGLATLVVLSGIRTWWHEPWGDRLLHAEVPALADPNRTTVLMIEGDPPWAWLAIAFPVQVAFVQIQGNFPQGPGYAERVEKILLDRNGPVFAQFSGAEDDAAERAQRIRDRADRLGLTGNPGRCRFLEWTIEKFRLRAAVVHVAGQADGADVACRLEAGSKGAARDVEAENRLARDKARAALEQYGFTIEDRSCSLYRAGIASDVRSYQWCAVTASTKRSIAGP